MNRITLNTLSRFVTVIINKLELLNTVFVNSSETAHTRPLHKSVGDVLSNKLTTGLLRPHFLYAATYHKHLDETLIFHINSVITEDLKTTKAR